MFLKRKVIPSRVGKKYVIDISVLEPGDIILTAASTKTSRLIRALCFSKYSHAAIWVNGTMVEATLNGVFSKNPQRVVVDKAEHLAVYRSKQRLSSSVKQQICDFARLKVGGLYSRSEAAMMLPLRLIKYRSSGREFCSRLVAGAYKNAGVELPDIKSPEYCSPRHLAKSESFEKVKGVVREASPEEISFSESEDPNQVHQENTFNWLNKVRKLAESNSGYIKDCEITTLNDVNSLLLRYPEFDEKVTKYILDTEYLSFFNYDRRVNPYRYDRIEMVKLVSKNPMRAEEVLARELKRERSDIQRHSRSLESMYKCFQRHKLNYFFYMLELYKNLMCETQARLECLFVGSSVIGFTSLQKQIKALSPHILKQITQAEALLGKWEPSV